MFGRWYELVSKNKKGLFGKPTQPKQQSTPSMQENEPEKQALSQEPQTKENNDGKNEKENETGSQNSEVSVYPPTEEDFDIPMNEEQYESMVDRFATIGLKRPDVDKVLEARRTAFNKAQREFKIAERKKKAEESKANKKPRKNSLNK